MIRSLSCPGSIGQDCFGCFRFQPVVFKLSEYQVNDHPSEATQHHPNTENQSNQKETNQHTLLQTLTGSRGCIDKPGTQRRVLLSLAEPSHTKLQPGNRLQTTHIHRNQMYIHTHTHTMKHTRPHTHTHTRTRIDPHSLTHSFSESESHGETKNELELKFSACCISPSLRAPPCTTVPCA